MKTQLSRQPYFVLLLPLFFVFHGYADNFHYLSFVHTLPLLGVYVAASVIVYLLVRIAIKSPVKAGLFAVYLMAFFFFFGFIFDTLKAHAPYRWMYKYSFLFALFFMIAIGLFLFLFKTKRSLGQTAIFLNLLFGCYLLFDLGMVLYKNLSVQDNRKMVTGTDVIPAGSQKPDIYLLLFDEYAGNLSLKQWMDYDNTAKDSFLRSKGFFVARKPFSNYKHTPFSMASMLNMDYIPWYRENTVPTRDELIQCGTLVKYGKVMRFLDANGYEIVNNSIFDIERYPAHINQRLLPVNTRLITEETLIYRLSVHFEWWFQKQPLLKKIFPVMTKEDEIANIERAIALTMKEPFRQSMNPRFVYGHFLVPHLPVYFDSSGNRLPDGPMKKATTLTRHYESYRHNLQFANSLIRKMVTTIQQQTNNKAVILVMSDHGLRQPQHQSQPTLAYNNLNAVFLPDGKYEGWADSTTNVNQFRILFNTLFNMQYKLLPDSCVAMGQ